MKIVAITGPRQSAIVEKPTPHAHENVVVVKVHVAPLCTECKSYQAGHVSDCLGHEALTCVASMPSACSSRASSSCVCMRLARTSLRICACRKLLDILLPP